MTWRDGNFPTRTGPRTRAAVRAAESGHALPWDGVEEPELQEASSSRRTEAGYVEWSTDIEGPEELPLKLVRPACPKCFMELPVSGLCGFC